jgi:hypothetical protein
MKLLLAEVDDAAEAAAARKSAPTPAPSSALKVPASKWVELCGSAETAANYHGAISTELRNFTRFGRDFPWKEPSALPWLTWENLLWAASWFHDNRLALKEARDSEMAYTFQLMHGADAPFIAAVNLCDFHTHRVDRADIVASLAFMRFYAEEMNEWYDYDIQSKEPMVEHVAKGCRCLPRHIKTCPVCK